MSRNGLLTVHEVTARTGLSRKALRLYEERGFVVPDRTDTGYRLYDERLYNEQALRRLELNGRARALEMSTRELGEFLDIAEGCCERDAGELGELVRDKLAETELRLGELAARRHTLQQTLATLRADVEQAQGTRTHVCSGLLCTCTTPASRERR